MQRKYIWVGLVLIVGIGVMRWSAVAALDAVAPIKQGVSARPARPVPAPSPGRVPHPPAPLAAEEATLAVRIDRLIATHDPENAHEAYMLIAECDIFNREHDRMIFDIKEVTQKHNMFPYRGMNDSEKQHDAKLCTGMSERMRLSRLDYLAIAAKAGIGGAVVGMAMEGPFGDRTALTTRPDDPLVQEWKAQVRDQLTKSADDGNMLTLNYLWGHTSTGDELIAKDPALAYRYALAQGLIFRELNGPEAPGATMHAPDDPFMMSIVELSAEQRMAERAAAQGIADRARERRRREAKEP